MTNEAEEQPNYRPWMFQKGKSGNPGGRPKGSKSLKTRAREYLSQIETDEDAEVFFDGIPKIEIWKMAEGNPTTQSDITSGGKPIPLFDYVRHNDGNPQSTEPKPEN